MGSVELLLCFLLSLLRGEEVAEAVEVFLHDDAEALGVERRLGEVTVVGLIIDLEGEVAVGVEEVLHVEVADERRGGLLGIVAIAELAIDEQPVVKHPAVYNSLIFSIMPSLVSSRDVSAEVPVVVLDKLVDERVDLR